MNRRKQKSTSRLGALLLALVMLVSFTGVAYVPVYADEVDPASIGTELSDETEDQVPDSGDTGGEAEDEGAEAGSADPDASAPEDTQQGEEGGQPDGTGEPGENTEEQTAENPEAPETAQQPQENPDAGNADDATNGMVAPSQDLLSSFYGTGDPNVAGASLDITDDLPVGVPLVYSLTTDYRIDANEGPYWFYYYTNPADNGVLTLYTSTGSYGGETRWAEGTYNTRVFNNGPMPAGTGSAGGWNKADAVIGWRAPASGLVELTAGAFTAGSVSSQGGEIKMETNRADRDGITVSVQHNEKNIWPDQGGMNTNYRKHTNPVEFEPLRVYVEEGDFIYFRGTMNDNKDNTRCHWAPVIQYIDDGSVITGEITHLSNGSLRFPVQNYSGTPSLADVELYVSLDDQPSTPVTATAVSYDGGIVTVSYNTIAPAITGEVSVAQLTCLFDGGDGAQGRIVTFAVDDSTDTFEAVVTAHGGGSVTPSGEFFVTRGSSQTFTLVANAGYGVELVELNGEAVDEEHYAGGTYTVDDIQDDFTLDVYFAEQYLGGGTTYYLDPEGDDENEGTSEEAPWRSLEKVNETVFLPGDNILFKSGGIWTGYLWPQGEGEKGNPITIGKYGGDTYPILNNGGAPPHASAKATNVLNPTVHLVDQSYWVIQHLEVTNTADTAWYNNVAIQVNTTGLKGRTYGVTVRECYIHDVTGDTSNWKFCGGIQFTQSSKWIDGIQLDTTDIYANKADSNIGIGFQDVLVENNRLYNVAIEGIRTSAEESGPFRNSSQGRNIVIRGNYLENIYGDGIVPAEVNGAIIERNIVKNHCNVYAGSTNYAGMWGWYTLNTIYRFNEVFGGEYGYNDGEAYDFDSGNQGVVYEYNLSHHNKGGFLLTMGGAGLASNIVRYNISANDGRLTSSGYSQELFHVQVANLQIYNNTFYIGKNHAVDGVFTSGSVNNFKNNIILCYGNMKSFASGSLSVAAGGVTNNIFYPGSIMQNYGLSESVLQQNILANPRLSSPELFVNNYAAGGYDVTWDNMTYGDDFIAKLRNRAVNFRLTEDSPAIGAGVRMASHPDTDFFGNSVGDLVDIGAHQYNGDPGPIDDNDYNTATAVRLDSVATYMVEGDMVQLNATVLPANILDTGVVWTSSNPDVAKVSVSGRVTAVEEGTAVITATSSATPAVYMECTIYVGVSEVPAYETYKDGYARDNGSTIAADTETLEVKKDASGYNRKTAMAFNIPELPDEYSDIQLQMYIVSTNTDLELQIDYAGSSWNEALTWAGLPTVIETVTKVDITQGMVGSWVSVDVTEFIEGLVGSGITDFTFVLESLTSMGNKDALNIASRESVYGGARIVFGVSSTVVDIENRSVRTRVGTAPELPRTVLVSYYDGSTDNVEVDWETIDSALYAQEGAFAAVGSIEGTQRPVLATVQVLDNYPVEIEPVEVSTPAGIEPVLPAVVSATMATGETKELPVIWAYFPASSYASPGTFTVAGTVDDYEGSLVATVVVTDPVVVSVEGAKARGFVGHAPKLPAEVLATFSDGSKDYWPVVWNQPTQEQLSTAGTFLLYGVSGDVEAVIEVTLYSITGVDPVTVRNPVGRYPQLPSTVNVRVDGGQPVAAEVEWPAVPAARYKADANFTVTGTVLNAGITVEARVEQIAAITYERLETDTIKDSTLKINPSDEKNGTASTVFIKGYTGASGGYYREGYLGFQLDPSKVDSLTELKLMLPLKTLEQVSGRYLDAYYFEVYVTNTTAYAEDMMTFDGVSQEGNYKHTHLGRVVLTADQIDTYVEIDVTDALGYVNADGTIAFLLAIDENPPGSNDGQNGGIQFYSKEAGDNPLDRPAHLVTDNDYITGVTAHSARVRQGTYSTVAMPGLLDANFLSGKTETLAVDWDVFDHEAVSPGTHYVVGSLLEGRFKTLAEINVLEAYKLLNKDGFGLAKDGSLTFVVNGELAEFGGLVLNGTELTPDEHFTAQSGSVVITLLPAVVEGLEFDVEHTLDIYFEDAIFSVTFIITEEGAVVPVPDPDPDPTPTPKPDPDPTDPSPSVPGAGTAGSGSGGVKTGDASNVWPLFALGVFALYAVVGVLVVKRSTKRSH